MSRMIFILLMLGLLAPGAGAEEFVTAGFEKLVIVLPSGTVNLQTGSGPTVRVNSVNYMSWSAREDGKTLRLTATLNPGVPRSGNSVPVKMDVIVPAIAVDLHLTEGQVQITKWQKPLLIDLQNGRVNAKDNRATLWIQLAQGQVSVSEHVGHLRLDVFRADSVLTSLQGNLDFSGHQGDLRVDKASGNLQLQLYQGGVDIKNSGGSLQYQIGKASMLVSTFKGRVEGHSDEGNVNLGLASETEVAIKSGTGRVTLDSKNSGSLLVLRAEEGEITGMKNLRAGKDRGAQVLRGRLTGSGGGRVEVVAAKGNIFVKE